MGNSTSKTDSNFVGTSQRKDASSILSGGSTQRMGIIALPPHLQLSSTMSDDESSLLSGTSSFTPIKSMQQRLPSKQIIHRDISDVPLLEKQTPVQLTNKPKKKKWSLGARKRVLNNLRGVKKRSSLLIRASSGDGKRNGKGKEGENKNSSSIPSSLYIPRDDSWRSAGEFVVGQRSGPLTVDASQQLHLALPLVSPLPVPSSGLTPTNDGVLQSTLSASLAQPMPLPSPQPSPRRSRHPTKQEANIKAKKSNKVPTKKKVSGVSTKPSLYKKKSPEDERNLLTGSDFNGRHASADISNGSDGVWKPLHEKASTSMSDLFASINETSKSQPFLASESHHAEGTSKRKENDRSSKSSIFKGLKKQFHFKKREDDVTDRVENPVENGTSKILKGVAALQKVASSEEDSLASATDDLNQSRDGHLLGMMPNAPLNLSQVDLEASYTSSDRSFAESEAGIGNLDMSRLLGNIAEEDEDEIERNIENEFLFHKDEVKVSTAKASTGSEPDEDPRKLEIAGNSPRLKTKQIELFDVPQSDALNSPETRSKGGSTDDWNVSPIQQRMEENSNTVEDDGVSTRATEKTAAISSDSTVSTITDSSTVKTPTVSLGKLFADMSMKAPNMVKSDDKNLATEKSTSRDICPLLAENIDKDGNGRFIAETSTLTNHDHESRIEASESSAKVANKEEIKDERMQPTSKMQLPTSDTNKNSASSAIAPDTSPKKQELLDKDSKTKNQQLPFQISREESHVIDLLSIDDDNKQQLVLFEESSCALPQCESSPPIENAIPQIVDDSREEDIQFQNSQMLSSLPHGTPSSLMSMSDSLNTSLRRSSPRRAISKEAMFNASFLFSPNNNAFLARRNHQSRLPVIEDNFRSMTIGSIDARNRLSSGSTVSGLSSNSPEGRLSTDTGVLSSSSVKEWTSRKDKSAMGNVRDHTDSTGDEEAGKHDKSGLKHTSPKAEVDKSAISTPVTDTSNILRSEAVADDADGADSLFTTESNTMNKNTSLHPSGENEHPNKTTSCSPSGTPSRYISECISVGNEQLMISPPEILSVSKLEEEKLGSSESRDRENDNGTSNSCQNSVGRKEACMTAEESSEFKETSETTIESTHKPMHNLNNDSPKRVSSPMSQHEATSISEEENICDDEVDKQSVPLTPWKNAHEKNSVRTISPIRRFRSAKEKFSRPVTQTSSMEKSLPRKMFETSGEQSVVLSRVTEIDGRLRKNRPITRRNKRRDTSGGGVLAPRKATLVNPLFARVPSVDEGTATSEECHIDCDDNNEECPNQRSYQNNSDSNLVCDTEIPVADCSEKEHQGSGTLVLAGNFSVESNGIQSLRQPQRRSAGKYELEAPIGEPLCSAHADEEKKVDSIDQNKESADSPTITPKAESVVGNRFDSINSKHENMTTDADDSSIGPSANYADQYLSQTSSMLVKTESNSDDTHVDTPRMMQGEGNLCEEENLDSAARKYDDRFLGQISHMLPQDENDSCHMPLTENGSMSNDGNFDIAGLYCKSPESERRHTLRDVSFISTESDDVFATLMKGHQKSDTELNQSIDNLLLNDTDSDQLAALDAKNTLNSAIYRDSFHTNHVRTSNVAKTEEMASQYSANVGSLNSSSPGHCFSSNDDGVSQNESIFCGNVDDKENLSPQFESSVNKSVNKSFVSQTDLCLSPVQRTSLQARKWRTLAAAAAANKSSTKKAVRKKGRKKKVKKGQLKPRTKARALRPEEGENAGMARY